MRKIAGAFFLGAVLLAGPAGEGKGATALSGPGKAATSASGEAAPGGETGLPSARQAATRLRGMYFARDFEGAVAEGRSIIGRFPDPGEARAWYLVSLGEITGGEEPAVAEAERWVAARPDDPWARFALAGALDGCYDRFGEALPASRRAFRLRRDHPDFIWLHARVLSDSGRDQEALDLIDRSIPRSGNPAELLVLRGNVLLNMSRGEKPNEAIRAGAFREFAKARKADPASVNAHFRPGYLLLFQRRIDEALPLLRKAADLSPFSTGIHRSLWRALLARTEAPAEENRREVMADIGILLRARGSYPGTLLAVSGQYTAMGMKEKREEIDRRILKEFPDSREAEWVLVNRQRDFASEHHGEEMKKPEVQAKYRKMLREFLARPEHREVRLLGDVCLSLFFSLKDDPAVGADELLQPIRGMLNYERGNLHATYPAAACALADRKARLDEAEKIVGEGFQAVRREGERSLAYRYDSRRAQKEWVRYLDALMLDASGWVHFNQGKREEAEEELARARKVLKASEVNLYHLGCLAEAKGDLNGAEKLYAQGMAVQTPRENPCVKALQDLYVRRSGSLDGFDAYAEKFRSEDRAKRKERILAERIAAPEPIPPFDLKALDGARISAAKLKGRILVVNFWGVWCGWCLEEMPEIQRLYEKYRSDPEVSVLTIDNDPNPDTVREWMKKKGFTFPVLLDDGYVSAKARVQAFPTTWFVDRSGRTAFIRDGWSKELVEEYGWRIDALRGESLR